MKKLMCMILCLFVLFSSPVYSYYSSGFAESAGAETIIEDEIFENVQSQINALDFSGLENVFDEYEMDIFKTKSFSENVVNIINGNSVLKSENLLGYFFEVFMSEILAFLPYVCMIIAVSILYSLVGSGGDNKGLSDVIHFACFGSIVVIMLFLMGSLTNIAINTINNIKQQMGLIFPILLTVMTTLGTVASVSTYQPAMAVLSGGVLYVFTNVLMPLFTFRMVFTIISNLSNTIKFNKFAEFFDSCIKWILGIVVTIFTAFVSIKGLMSGSIDSVSLRTAKYTIKGAVPIVGGFISDGVGLIMLSSTLIKNAVGVAGLVLLFVVVLIPIVKILVFSLMTKLSSAILEPIADARVTNFISAMSKILQLLIAIILCVSFMYLILVSLVMCSSNFIY